MRTSPPTVLIVDDSTAIRKILCRALSQTGITFGEALEAGDGCDALKLLESHAVSLILLDINMPRMDGLEFLRILRGSPQWGQIPVVIVSTESEHSKVREALELGAASYIRKPFNADLLRDKLAHLLCP